MFSRTLKALARELNLPVLALSQLSRAIERRDDQTPRLSDLRESGAIEQDADVVMFIHREFQRKVNKDEHEKRDEDPNESKAMLLVRKQRNGPTGDVHLYFAKEYTRFESAARDDYDEVPFA